MLCFFESEVYVTICSLFRIDVLLMMGKLHVCILKIVLPCPVWPVLIGLLIGTKFDHVSTRR